MLTYKGYDIPNTYDELEKYLSEHHKDYGKCGLPTVEYYMSNERVIEIPLTLEDFSKLSSDKKKSEEVAEMFCNTVVEWIDAFNATTDRVDCTISSCHYCYEGACSDGPGCTGKCDYVKLKNKVDELSLCIKDIHSILSWVNH